MKKNQALVDEMKLLLLRRLCLCLSSSFYHGHWRLNNRHYSTLHACSKSHDPISNAEEVKHSPSSKPRKQIALLTSEANEPVNLRSKASDSEQPWPEWVELMELLRNRGYFELGGYKFGRGQSGANQTNYIRTACLNFARDRSQLIRCLSREDIQVIARCGCPNVDRKVVNSAKRLRAHLGVDEGSVCSSCNLRGDCDRAYMGAHEDQGGRTVDVMRIVMTYGLDLISRTLENKLCQNKMVNESVRRLLKEMVENSCQQPDSDAPLKMSAYAEDHSGPPVEVPRKPGDWLCPKCNFLNFARNIKCLRCDGLFQERLNQLKEDQDHLPLKKGDWICEKCNFLNFAKNTRCLQCKEKPVKRNLNPGEWECESCNYINFRSNMVCLKCNHRRPKASNALKASTQPENDSGGNANNSRSGILDHRTEARDCRIYEPNRMNHSGDADTWEFVKDEEDYESKFIDEDSRFVVFPISGGKSSLSQDVKNREKWKLEMLERSRGEMKIKEEDEELGSDPRLEYLESGDDEDIIEWFGYEKKTGRKSSMSAPEES